MKNGNQSVIIVGGGPAGSAVGSYLSMAGIPNTIIEKEIHPRPHVGESLVPITTRYLILHLLKKRPHLTTRTMQPILQIARTPVDYNSTRGLEWERPSAAVP